MPKALKCQFHAHTAGDPLDAVRYSPKELIDHAAQLNYDVVSITCHRKLLFSQDLKKYAASKNILLLPGIEFEIKGRHILCINAHPDIEHVDSFHKLEKYRKSHSESFIIAPHPYFPGKMSLHHYLLDYAPLFDGIEHSFWYSSLINYNKRAKQFAPAAGKPLIATADAHFLKQLAWGYCLVEAEKNPKAIFEALRKGKFTNYTKPLSHFQMGLTLIQLLTISLFKKFS